MRTIKLVVIGDSGVGKTSIRGQYISGRFSSGYRATIGTDFITKILPHYSDPTESVTLQIWDTAGQERFSSLSSAFFRGADAALLVFDVNRPETLAGLKKWWQDFKGKAPVSDEEAEDYCCVIVGNKIDLVQDDVESTADEDTEGAGPSRLPVSEADARSFLEELIPRTSPSEEDPFSESPSRTRSVDIQGSSSSHQNHFPFKRPSKSRSAERSYGGTMTTTHTSNTIYHTPSSSLFDRYDSRPSSPLSPRPRSPSVHTSPERLQRTESEQSFSSLADSTSSSRHRRNTSASMTSSAPTITPSLFATMSKQSSASMTPPTPVEPEDETLTRKPISLPEKRPKLFFTSAKTGANVPDVFEYIARRVVSRWEYEEQQEERILHVAEGSVGTLRLGRPTRRNELNSIRWMKQGSCCGS